MKLPNHEHAIINLQKLRDYCLNPEHPRGKHKARVFQAALGFVKEDAENLKGQIFARIQVDECQLGAKDAYGQRYTVDVEISGKTNTATVRTGWIIKSGEQTPQFTTCFVK